MNSDQNVKTVDVDVRDTISKSNIPKYSKILVPDDGKEISDKAINHAISVSNFSGAEIVILRIIENIEKMGDTSVSVSKNKEPDTESGFKHNIEGELANAMEEKIKRCVEAGATSALAETSVARPSSGSGAPVDQAQVQQVLDLTADRALVDAERLGHRRRALRRRAGRARSASGTTRTGGRGARPGPARR